MTAYITFYPLKNADTSLIQLADDNFVLVDFANMKDPEDRSDKRCDLPAELNNALRKSRKDDFDVVCFTHLDDDHCKGMGDYFELQYKEDTHNADRPQIRELWVPAAAITETGVKDDAWAVRQEARHRLKNGSGIKVFSRPEALEDFLKENKLSIAERRDCIVDAGKVIPKFSLEGPEKAEFFLHCPFAVEMDDRQYEDRNQDSAVFHVTFKEEQELTRAIFGSDVNSETLSQIIDKTKKHNNEDRLLWDILKLPHHCSYTSLNKDDRGIDETTPVDDVKWLIEEQGQHRCRIVSPSKPIPQKGTKDDRDKQPPHRQAYNYYNRICKNKDGQIKVTMEEPNASNPKSIKIEITERGAQFVAVTISSIGTATQRPTRQG